MLGKFPALILSFSLVFVLAAPAFAKDVYFKGHWYRDHMTSPKRVCGDPSYALNRLIPSKMKNAALLKLRINQLRCRDGVFYTLSSSSMGADYVYQCQAVYGRVDYSYVPRGSRHRVRKIAGNLRKGAQPIQNRGCKAVANDW